MNNLKSHCDYLECLETSKPMFFQKKKLKEHNDKIIQCERYIEELKNKLLCEREFSETILKEINFS